MIVNTRTLSTLDTRKLRKAVDRAARCWMTDVPHLDLLRSVLQRARAAPPAEFPSDLLTMNSRFVLKNVLTGESGAYELVYPAEEAVHRNRISVMSSAGMALLGARVGEERVWTSSAGPEVGLVQELLYQPEAVPRPVSWEPRAVTPAQAARIGSN
jgi:regulator of nucleoside diphosphate kinase